MDQNLKESLIKIAHADLRDVRKEGRLFVVYTKLGAIYISYDKATDQYTAGNGDLFVRKNKADMVEFLVKNYQVEEL